MIWNCVHCCAFRSSESAGRLRVSAMRASALLGLCVVLLPFTVALQCVTDNNGTTVSCPNSTQCYQTYQSNGTGYVVTYGCSKDECGSECGNSSRCLLTFTPLMHTLCCNYDLCNEDGVVIPHPPARLEFPWQIEFIAFIIYIAVLLFFFCYPFYISRKLTLEDLHYLKYEYNIDFDENPDDKDAHVCFKDEGKRGVTGFVALGELDSLAIGMKQNKTDTAADLHEDYAYPEPVITKCFYHHAAYLEVEKKPDTNRYTSLAHRMMARGPGYFEISPAELLEVLESLNVILRTEGPLLELPGNVVVVGDLRGNYADLMRWFQIHEYPPKHRYLFLGGIVDNSNPYSIETFILIAALKLILPHDVFMLRGATEVAPFIIRDRFPKELCNALSLVFASVFASMPMAAIIGGKVLAVHSGICKKMSSVARLKKREAPLNMGMGKMVRSSIFSVPKKDVEGYENIPGSKGQYYGEEALEDCAKALGISLFIRSRNFSSSGHFFFADRLLLTIWSTNTRDCASATTVLVDDFLNIEMHAMLPYCMVVKEPPGGDVTMHEGRLPPPERKHGGRGRKVAPRGGRD